jgi:hypothetical protein
MSLLSEVRWTVVALDTPRVIRHCPRCRRPRAFASSDAFRVNAQKRRLDVWLIYRCTECESTWNREILERCAPEDIAPDLYARFLENDRETAWSYAFEVTKLGGGDGAVPYRVEVAGTAEPGNGLSIEIALPRPCEVRLERLLTEGLGVSRSRLRAWLDSGEVSLSAGRLQERARTGQRIEIRRS